MQGNTIINMLLSLALASIPSWNHAQDRGNDKGFSIGGHFEIEETIVIEEGLTHELGHRGGMVYCENPESPFHYATMFQQGTVFRDTEGNEVGETSLVELTDRHGNTIWLVYEFWLEDGFPADFEIIGGTGKWKYITGTGRILGEDGYRPDHRPSMNFEAAWTLDENAQSNYDAEALAKERGWDQVLKLQSFHGPHVSEGIRKPGNGLQFVANTQRGVLTADDTGNSLHKSTWYSHDTSVKDEEGRTIADVLIGIVIDLDGDIIFYHQNWWYKEDRGRTYMFGGTGKWKGIEGASSMLDMIPREDDHFILNSITYYKIN